MITGDLKNKIDRIWETFWTGGITNPLDVIEQFTYLLFIKQLDEVETQREADAAILGYEPDRLFPDEAQEYRWSKFKNLGDAAKMYELIQNKVFPFIKNCTVTANRHIPIIWGMLYLKFLLLVCFPR